MFGYWYPEIGSIKLESNPFSLDSAENVIARSLWKRGNSTASGQDKSSETLNLGDSITARFGPAKTITIAKDGQYLERGVIAVEVNEGGRIKERLLEPMIPVDASGSYPLLLFGTLKNFKILATYDHLSKDKEGAIVGHLILGSIRDSKVEWQDIRGDYCSFVAGDRSDAVRLGDRIFIVACGKVMILDFKNGPPKLLPLNSANQLIGKVRDKSGDMELKISFGAYKDILLVSAQGMDEQWVWALQDDSFIGGMHITFSNSKLLLYNKDNAAIAEEVLPNAQAGIVLPNPGCNIRN